jgi:ribosome-binding factor A
MTQRTEKVGKLARQVLGEAIDTLKDPRVGFATITSVRVSADLRHAVVLVSVMGSEEEQKNTMAGLESAKAYLRGELGRQVRMKYTPDLHFHLDHGPEEAQRIETLFRELHDQHPEESNE